MPTIKELKEDLQFTAELIDLLEVMKNTAIFQFRALQAKRERFEKFFKAVEGFFPLIGGYGRGHVLMEPVSEKEAIIMVTSDEGFMGSLNSQVIAQAHQRKGFKDGELVIIGERGARYLKEVGRPFVPFKSAIDAKGRRSLASQLTSHILDGVKKARFGRVSISYPRSVSFMLQKVEVIEILPLLPAAETKEEGAEAGVLIVESPIDGIIDYLGAELVRQRLVDVLEDSKLSEFAARAMHLESSSQELAEKKKKTRLQYFKAHHEMIDKSTRELFSAQIIIRRKAAG